MQKSASTNHFFTIRNLAGYIDWAIVILFFSSGLLHPSVIDYYDSFWRIFVIIIVPLFSLSFILYRFSEKYGSRIQGDRNKIPPIAKEAFGSGLAMFVVASMAAWPVGLYRAGYPTGLAWTLEEMGLSWWMVILQMYAGIMLVDALTYWKHRLLHTRLFFPFHKDHHFFRDPTPFASFAVGPLETFLTFWPLLLICFPVAKHFAPLYFTAIIGFVFLNLYLHCGVTFRWLEKLLPKIGLNSSAWHNIHHSDVNSNFGEVSFIWDKVCKTTRADSDRKKKARTAA
jgi:sterol desaturase/sphingolipid hydroxylase (fatty acid hydroxylase superfamily)